mgnify:FL=1
MSHSTQSSSIVPWEEIFRNALPSFLREPIILALLQASSAPLQSLHSRARKELDHNRYRIKHNGQVCSLLGMLEEQYPSSLGIHYRIEDLTPTGRVPYAVTESAVGTPVPIALPSSATSLVTRSEREGAGSTSFLVCVPRDVFDTKLSEVQWLIDRYKLPTKHPLYKSINR